MSVKRPSMSESVASRPSATVAGVRLHELSGSLVAASA